MKENGKLEPVASEVNNRTLILDQSASQAAAGCSCSIISQQGVALELAECVQFKNLQRLKSRHIKGKLVASVKEKKEKAPY